MITIESYIKTFTSTFIYFLEIKKSQVFLLGYTKMKKKYMIKWDLYFKIFIKRYENFNNLNLFSFVSLLLGTLRHTLKVNIMNRFV